MWVIFQQADAIYCRITLVCWLLGYHLLLNTSINPIPISDDDDGQNKFNDPK